MHAELARLRDLFARQREAFARDPSPALETRLDRIRRLRELVEKHEDDFRVAMRSDFGSLHPAMVVMLDTLPVRDRVRHFEQHLAEWLAPRTVELGPQHGSSRGEILRVPKGVNGNIAPWNFPIESALVMTVDMLAAGNTVVVKPSELAPATAEALERAVAAHFAETELAVVRGGPELAQAFAALPWDHLTFTGSGRIGRLVLQAAAANLVPVTLELGGKNPALFAPDGVTEPWVGRFLAFRALKAGQICTSPDYALVPRDRVEAWVEIATRWWRERYPRYVGHPDATGIINEAHFRRVTGYVAEARARGVRVVPLGSEAPDAARREMPMTLVIDPPEDLGCMTDEVFGPVVPVVPYDDVAAAMERINAGPAPLGAYLVTADAALAGTFVGRVRCGGAAVNSFGLQGGHAALPFGGIGASGMGCHSGYEGFCNYTHVKSVFYGADDSLVHRVIVPPYPSVPS